MTKALINTIYFKADVKISIWYSIRDVSIIWKKFEDWNALSIAKHCNKLFEDYPAL